MSLDANKPPEEFREWRHAAKTAFSELTDDEFNEHLARNTYGNFELTDGIRPAPGFIPTEGFKCGIYENQVFLAASISRQKLFDIFRDFLEKLDETVTVVLETTHSDMTGDPGSLRIHDVDAIVLDSAIVRFENMLLHDGCTGISVFNPDRKLEVRLMNEKILVAYAKNVHRLKPFKEILRSAGIRRRSGRKLMYETDHTISTTMQCVNEFRELYETLSGEGSF